MKQGLMTEGNIFEKLILFSLPIMLGNFFQLMYNTIDSVIVGNYVGYVALAAVGTSTPIINLLIAFFQGLAVGAGVVVSKYFGARDIVNERKSVHTFLVFSIVFGIVLSVVGLLLSDTLLQWMQVQPDAFVQASDYLKIYFIGVIFVTVYNAGTGILQAVGDAKHPLYFLIISSLANVVLDIIFVKYFNMGVVGAALATIICEGLSMVLVLYELAKTDQEYKLSIKEMRMEMGILKQMVEIGVPSGVQGMVVSISNVVVFFYINGFDSVATAAFSSANKYDNFIGLPVNSFMLATTTFTGQNLGAKLFHRVKQGIHASLLMCCAITIVMSSLVFIFAPVCISFFSRDARVIAQGAMLMRVMSPFYIFLAVHSVFSGALRAAGHSNIPMLTSIISFVVLRQIYLAVVMPRFHNLSLIGYGYSFTWLTAAVLTSIYYFTSHWLKKQEAL